MPYKPPAMIRKMMPLSTGTHGGGQHKGEPLGGDAAGNALVVLIRKKPRENMNFKVFISNDKCTKNM